MNRVVPGTFAALTLPVADRGPRRLPPRCPEEMTSAQVGRSLLSGRPRGPYAELGEGSSSAGIVPLIRPAG